MPLEYELEQLVHCVQERTELSWDGKEVEAVLLWLHQQKVIRLTEGLNLFQQSLKVRVIKNSRVDAVTRRYGEVKAHYDEQTRRTHIMLEYGRLKSPQARQQFIADYFGQERQQFLEAYQSNPAQSLTRPVIPEDYERIISLLNPAQKEIVLAQDAALAVIAGPGSGKTRTIVHRIAYLVKVKRVQPQRILVLAYNRNAVRELRFRLGQIIGANASRLRVYTFHSLALALLGRTLGENAKGQEQDFEQLLVQACQLIEQGDEYEEVDEDTQARRIQLLGQLEYIFVDEYQDVGENEYRLIELIAGLGDSEDESRSSWVTQHIQNWINQGVQPRQIAVLARHWKSLDSVRLLLEQAGTPTYALRRDGIPLVRNYVTCQLINELKAQRHRVFTPNESIREWTSDLFATWGRWGRSQKEPTVRTLLKIAGDLDTERGYGWAEVAMPMSTDEVLTALFEYNATGEVMLSEEAVLVTSCHGAKGLEFQKVILLADDFSIKPSEIESERRLFYVAMTRAVEELVLCSTHLSLFVQETGVSLQSVSINTSSLPEQMTYSDLSPRPVNLDAWGTKNNQIIIEQLREGEELCLVPNKWNNGWDITTLSGRIVGTLSKRANQELMSEGFNPMSFRFLPGEVTVRNIYRHLKTDEMTGRTLEDWFVVIPQLRVCR